MGESGVTLRHMDSLGRQLGPHGVFETPNEKKKRTSSLVLASINIFVEAVMFSILNPSMIFLYRSIIGKPIDDPEGLPDNHITEAWQYAGLLLAFSCGQFLAAPIMHIWKLRRGYSEPFAFSKLVLFGGNIFYALSHNLWALFVARIFIGIGSSTTLISRSYISFASMKTSRALLQHINASIQIVGLFFGPTFAFMFISTDFPLWQDGPRINKYTAPAYLSAIFAICLFLCFLFIFQEFRIVAPKELHAPFQRNFSDQWDPRVNEETPLINSLPEEKVKGFDWPIIISGALFFIVVSSSFSVLVGLQPLLSFDNHGWGLRQNYVYFVSLFAIAFVCCGVVGALLMFVDIRFIFFAAFMLSSAGFFSRICGFDTEYWKIRYLALTAACIVPGFTFAYNILFGRYIKFLGFGEKETWGLAFYTLMNFSQLLAPIWSTALYEIDRTGTYVWVTLGAFFFICAVLLVLFWKRFVPKDPIKNVSQHQRQQEDEVDFAYADGYEPHSSFSEMNQEKFLSWRNAVNRQLSPKSPSKSAPTSPKKKKKKHKKSQSQSSTVTANTFATADSDIHSNHADHLKRDLFGNGSHGYQAAITQQQLAEIEWENAIRRKRTPTRSSEPNQDNGQDNGPESRKSSRKSSRSRNSKKIEDNEEGEGEKQGEEFGVTNTGDYVKRERRHSSAASGNRSHFSTKSVGEIPRNHNPEGQELMPAFPSNQTDIMMVKSRSNSDSRIARKNTNRSALSNSKKGYSEPNSRKISSGSYDNRNTNQKEEESSSSGLDDDEEEEEETGTDDNLDNFDNQSDMENDNNADLVSIGFDDSEQGSSELDDASELETPCGSIATPAIKPSYLTAARQHRNSVKSKNSSFSQQTQ